MCRKQMLQVSRRAIRRTSSTPELVPSLRKDVWKASAEPCSKTASCLRRSRAAMSASVKLLQRTGLASPTLSRFNSLRPQRMRAVELVQQQIKARNRILHSYGQMRVALKELQDTYTAHVVNPIGRYLDLKRSIKQVTILEKEYWTLVNLPEQILKETDEDYASRLLNFLRDRNEMECDSAKSTPRRGSISALIGASSALTRNTSETIQLQGLKDKSTDELEYLSVELQTDICDLARRYVSLRKVVSKIHNDYQQCKRYPDVARYPFIKRLTKAALRSPEFIAAWN